MRHISDSDIEMIVAILHRWKPPAPLKWEALRLAISVRSGVDLKSIWSRQSLAANESIGIAFGNAKTRLKVQQKKVVINIFSEKDLVEKIGDLEKKLEDLSRRYNILSLRHTVLLTNASLLPGGMEMLDIPIFDNTKSQT